MAQTKAKGKGIATKAMTDGEISSRVKKSGSYVNLKPKQIVSIVQQLTPEQQGRCFSQAKTVEPLDKVETAGIIAIHGLNPKDKVISKINLADRRKIIKNTWEKNTELSAFLEENNLMERANLLEEKTLPGDFSPSAFWDVLDEIVKDLDLSNPEQKTE